MPNRLLLPPLLKTLEEAGIARKDILLLIATGLHRPNEGAELEEMLGPDQKSRGLRFSDRRNIVCPWHGWEFDLESGRHCGDPKYRLRPVNVRVEDNRVYVKLPA